MKKISLVMMVVLMLSSSLVVNASEGNSLQGNQTGNRVAVQEKVQLKLQERMQTKYDDFFQTMNERQEARFEEFSTKWDQVQEKRISANENFLKLVTQYTPDLVDDFETAFDEHNTIHTELLATRQAIYTAFATETTAQLQALKAELDAKLASGEITLADARASQKALMTERKDAMKTLMDSYQAAIADEKAQQEIRIQEVNALRIELKAAIEVGDTETITSTIESLYTYLQEHIAFDAYKLSTLKSIFNL